MQPDSPHVQQEFAVVWSGGGRRYFTRKAALRGAAKAIIRNYLDGTGEEMGTEEFQRHVKDLVGKIERGERPELNFDWPQGDETGQPETLTTPNEKA